MRPLVCTILALLPFLTTAQKPTAENPELATNNIIWTSPSKHSGESMPCGGGDIGLNVWSEGGDVLFYVARSGTFDENNSLLKLGRVRLRLSPNPFEGGPFKQQLNLQTGDVTLTGTAGSRSAQVHIWVDVFRPVVHVEVSSTEKLTATASYESWRFQDRVLKGKENNQNSYKWAPQGEVKTRHDSISFRSQTVEFFHQNRLQTVFDVTVQQQGLAAVKTQLFNPLQNLIFGGALQGPNMVPAGTTDGQYLRTPYRSWALKSRQPARFHSLTLALHTTVAPAVAQWQQELQQTQKAARQNQKANRTRTVAWWREFWSRSFIHIQPEKAATNAPEWQAGRNYQLMRYLLGCNAFGQYPTKFNGGLFTYDPALTDSTLKFTPDFRNWGGGTHTAQNQRLVYWPLLKSGDAALLKPQFDFYLRLLRNAELRTHTYWNHPGACFTEQLENFGLPNPAEYNWKRPADFDKGMEHNAWLEYEWDTVLEFCLMMLDAEQYAGQDATPYLPFIESCLTFFDQHYQYLARQRGAKALDGEGHLVLYPGSGAETYKMAYNSTATIAGLRTMLTRLLALPSTYGTPEQRQQWTAMLGRIPEISLRTVEGHQLLAPAKLWERVNNTESPQLYPVFPWGIYGIGKPDLATAVNTYRYDPDVQKFRSHVGWKQHNIFAARLGLTEEAAELTVKKLQDSGRRFPAFWGPGYDWTPDHNWGGSGMIGLQEMLLQTDGRRIFLLPAWPRDWDVHFKLHAPYQTTVEAVVKDGKVQVLKVTPESRRKDVVVEE
ncbi:hypothetical protein J0X19_01870 [Hymenobacter sp. BT186]|uniref:DUF5703 domain-containing protein n=1 Tax=Hymenobacter telluris TaxID=2816474 RepID=A0A939JBW3_9BACT|nr:DUF5703 domain-containing protein [Hymenobacter telluris]MBO0356682.1 hypothetical protein [Hymenobacter telluris]MBW3372707.1 hypothetical protein [Hymenobacter norwichensis]